MKRISLILSIVSLIAVIILYVITLTRHHTQPQPAFKQSVPANPNGLKIAYVKADSVILNYKLAQDLQDDFSKKQEAYTNEYSNKRSAFEKDAADFQDKLKRGGFLTEDLAQREHDRLMDKQQEIQQLDQDLTSRLQNIQSANNQRVLDSLTNCLNVLNKGWHFDYILNGADVLVGLKSSNVTQVVLAKLNDNYNKNQKKR